MPGTGTSLKISNFLFQPPDTFHFSFFSNFLPAILLMQPKVSGSISFLAASHSSGYSFAALKINRSTNLSPTGNTMRSMDSGNTKCVPCSYTSGTYSQVCGRSFSRLSIRRIYFPASQKESSSAPTRNNRPFIFSTLIISLPYEITGCQSESQW